MYRLILTLVLMLTGFHAIAQCPVNIGFESGNFDNWQCSIGTVSVVNGGTAYALSPSSPTSGRHTIITAGNPQQLDPYGNFAVNCPNGSNYSIRLGNSKTGREAERVSYTFIIPANQNNYSIIYNYAVVFQNPGHSPAEQPKFTANVFDVTDGDVPIGCSSFSYTASSDLPGFQQSTVADSIFFKDWTPVTIKLTGYAGKTIRLEFTTNDCTRGGHFGYAYVDVNENCESPILGNTQCVSDTVQTLTAPFGFASYKWYSADFKNLLDTQISIRFKPLPPINTVYAVEVTPYPEQGCIDTVYTTIQYSADTVHLQLSTPQVIGCEVTGVDITGSLLTAGSSPGLTYTYYTDPALSHYLSAPKLIKAGATYYIKGTNSVGCSASVPITVQVSPPVSVPALSDVTVARPNVMDMKKAINGDTTGWVITYWLDYAATIPLTHPDSIVKSGTYYIKATNAGGCFDIKAVNVNIIEPVITPPNAFSPNGDGIHDRWEIPLIYLYPDCIVTIYNRLGQVVFHSVGYNTPWDGKYKGLDIQAGTYYYVLKLSPKIPPQGGSLTLLR
ncbi:MAG: gliding motility-associated C-terminal domain-containing protein [Bacteroidota bacterium]|nr:gliding motility-associated C-terminal domain-containing protein [Bacteroidota bacterium]